MAAIDEYLTRLRAGLDRVTAEELEAELAAGAILVDIRPVELRERDGEIPGALIIDRNVLEWRLDQTCEWRSVDLEEGQRVILFCNESYASSMAAVTLREIGVSGATDLIGGYQAWLALQPEGMVNAGERGAPNRRT